jgi:hypothetical protein
MHQCIGQGPESGNSSIPAGNCGPVSSDLYVLDRHVRILYELTRLGFERFYLVYIIYRETSVQRI